MVSTLLRELPWSSNLRPHPPRPVLVRPLPLGRDELPHGAPVGELQRLRITEQAPVEEVSLPPTLRDDHRQERPTVRVLQLGHRPEEGHHHVPVVGAPEVVPQLQPPRERLPRDRPAPGGNLDQD